MEVTEEGSSDSEEVVFFNSEQKGGAVERQKLKVEVLARSNKTNEGELVCQSKPNGKQNYPVKGENLPTQRKRSNKRMVNQSLKNGRRCEIGNKTDNNKNPSTLTAISESLLDDSLEFAKRFNADVNFVHAKFAARKPLGLRVEEKRKMKSRSSRLKLERALLHADIVVIKQSLDIGGTVSARSGGLLTPVMESFSKSGDSKGEKQVSKKRKSDPPAGTSEGCGMSSAAPVCPATVSKAPDMEAAPLKHANSIMPSTSTSSMLEGKVEAKPQHGGSSKPGTKKVRFILKYSV